MYCTVLYCTVLYCTILYCTVLEQIRKFAHREQADNQRTIREFKNWGHSNPLWIVGGAGQLYIYIIGLVIQCVPSRVRHCVIQFFSSPEGYQWKNTLTTILDCYKETPEIYLNPQIAIWGDRLDNLARVPLNTRNQFKLIYLYLNKSYLLQHYFYFYD